MELQSDLSISYAKNETLRDKLTSSDAKQNEMQELIRYYEGTIYKLDSSHNIQLLFH